MLERYVWVCSSQRTRNLSRRIILEDMSHTIPPPQAMWMESGYDRVYDLESCVFEKLPHFYWIMMGLVVFP
jgi:hypothetical protein